MSCVLDRIPTSFSNNYVHYLISHHKYRREIWSGPDAQNCRRRPMDRKVAGRVLFLSSFPKVSSTRFRCPCLHNAGLSAAKHTLIGKGKIIRPSSIPKEICRAEARIALICSRKFWPNYRVWLNGEKNVQNNFPESGGGSWGFVNRAHPWLGRFDFQIFLFFAPGVSIILYFVFKTIWEKYQILKIKKISDAKEVNFYGKLQNYKKLKFWEAKSENFWNSNHPT